MFAGSRYAVSIDAVPRETAGGGRQKPCAYTQVEALPELSKRVSTSGHSPAPSGFRSRETGGTQARSRSIGLFDRGCQDFARSWLATDSWNNPPQKPLIGRLR